MDARRSKRRYRGSPHQGGSPHSRDPILVWAGPFCCCCSASFSNAISFRYSPEPPDVGPAANQASRSV